MSTVGDRASIARESLGEFEMLAVSASNQASLVGLSCAFLCGLGYMILSKELPDSHWRALSSGGSKGGQKASRDSKQILIMIATAATVYATLFLLIGSASIAAAIALLATSIPFLINKNRIERVQRARELAWPEAIDSLVSALQSGVSISDALLSLSDHGPHLLRPSFGRIKSGVRAEKSLENAMLEEKGLLNSAVSDQVFETLLLAREFGGKDSNNALRLLSEFVRDDIEVVEEIRTKFGWIRNSAALASAAPWLLLFLLSSQKTTVEAFATSAGVGVLMLGVVMTAVAYLWMEKVGKLPRPARALR